MIETIEIRWDMLGAKLAHLSDEEQSAFFNGFGIELSKYESQYKAQMQMAWVKDKLKKEAIGTLKETLPMFWCDEAK